MNLDNLVNGVIERSIKENRPQGDILEEMLKTHNQPDQSIDYEHNKTFNESITPNLDLDNAQIYDTESGQTIKEL